MPPCFLSALSFCLSAAAAFAGIAGTSTYGIRSWVTPAQPATNMPGSLQILLPKHLLVGSHMFRSQAPEYLTVHGQSRARSLGHRLRLAPLLFQNSANTVLDQKRTDLPRYTLD